MSVATHIGSGKVREIFRLDDRTLLLLASDRISAYDVVMNEPIPDKGRVLTGLSCFWFDRVGDICENHLVSVAAADLAAVELPNVTGRQGEDVGQAQLTGRAMLCRAADPLAVEFVVRGYLSGSGWREYEATGAVCGHRLAAGLRESEQLPEPLLTPATKALEGHDENITEARAAEICGGDVYEQARSYALAIYERARAYAWERGLVLADTKFEFGLADGKVILIDEVLTPDSSRLWPADRYEPGGPQPSFDKQYLRDWLDSTGWDHSPPPPTLPQDVIDNTRSRYLEAYERVSGRPLEQWLAEVGA